MTPFDDGTPFRVGRHFGVGLNLGMGPHIGVGPDSGLELHSGGCMPFVSGPSFGVGTQFLDRTPFVCGNIEKTEIIAKTLKSPQLE